MCLGGAIAGLAGMAQVSGFYGMLLLNFSTGLGFMGFLICWLAGGEPLGILLMSFVVSVITTGGNMLQLTRDLPYASSISCWLSRCSWCWRDPPSSKKGKKHEPVAILGVFPAPFFPAPRCCTPPSAK